MHLERTGINEPAIILELLKEQHFIEVGQRNDPPGSTETWQSISESEIRWVVFGEIEIHNSRGSFSLVSGDYIIMNPGEIHLITVGSTGAGTIAGIKNEK